jgi:hypothetical protein
MGAVSFSVLVLSLALPPNVFWIMLFIGTVFASSWGPVAFMSVWSRRITADGRLLGHGHGPARQRRARGAGFRRPHQPAELPGPGSAWHVAGFLVIVLVSRRGEPSPAERRYLTALHRTPTEDRDPQRTRVTLIAPALLVLYGLVMPFLLLQFYVLPYQRGKGTTLAGGTLNWGEAEPWIAFGPAATGRCRKSHAPPQRQPPTAELSPPPRARPAAG